MNVSVYIYSIYVYACIYIYMCVCVCICMYVYVYIVISDPRHIVLKSHKSKMSTVYMQSWKQFALLVITTIALWQFMHLGTWCTVTHCWYQWTKECSTSQARTLILWPLILCSLLGLLNNKKHMEEHYHLGLVYEQ